MVLLLSITTLLCTTTATSLSASAIENTSVLSNSNDFNYNVIGAGLAEVTGYKGSYTECTIPASINGYKIVRIADDAFYESKLTSVKIPDTVTEIGSDAFAWSDIIIINIPDSVTEIEESAFSYCEKLKNVALGNGLSIIGPSAFCGCENIASIKIPSNTKSIGKDAFWYCSSLKSISIPNSVTTLGENAFYGCEKLENVALGNSVTTLGKNAFSGCSSLKSISIPNSVKTLGEGAFSECDSLQSVSIGTGVSKIGTYTFANCYELNSISISANVKTIGENAFYQCSKLSSVNIPKGVQTIEKSAFMQSGVSNVTIPNTVTSIGENAFWYCMSLKSVTIPASVKTIGKDAFGHQYYFEPSSFTIKGYKNTVAEKYAKNHGFKFVNIGTVVNPSSVKLNRSSLTLGAGEKYGLIKTISPSNANQSCSWSSSNSRIASVDSNGKVTAKSPGWANITVKTSNGKTASCKVTVKSAPSSVKTNPTSLTLGKGESYTISENTNSGSYAWGFSWSSSNNSVATVKKGSANKAIVTAKGVGTAYIKIKLYNGKTAQCKVTVKNAPTSVKTNPTSLTLGKGETYTISEITNSGSYANAANLKWSTSKSSVATVTKGSGNKAKITAKGVGTAYIKITLYNGKTAQCKVTVKNAPTSVKTNPTSLTLGKGETYTISESTNNGSYANAANLKWSTSKSSVATVTKGSGNKAKITAKGVGTAYIKITLYNGKTAQCKVTVKNAPTSVKTNPTNLTLGKGETYTISEITNSGSYANAANLKWSTSNSSVATVTKGSGNKAKITAKGVGTAYIKITLYNGKTAQCKVTVEEDYAKEVFNLLNKERTKAGVPELKLNSNLAALADIRAKELVSNYSHTRADGTTVFDMAKSENIKFNVIGENIAYGQSTPSAVISAWLISPPHRKNMLSGDYKSVGIGHYQSGNTHYWVQVFIG